MKGRRPFSLALIVAGGLFAGCSSSQMSRIDSERDVYETWPLDVMQAVLDGRAEPGMTPEMVKMAMGKPTEVVARGNGKEELWIYIKGGEDESSAMNDPGYGMGANTGGMSVGTALGGGGRNSGLNVGVGGGMGSMGNGPMRARRITPIEVREVVFRDGVVERATPGP